MIKTHVERNHAFALKRLGRIYLGSDEMEMKGARVCAAMLVGAYG